MVDVIVKPVVLEAHQNDGTGEGAVKIAKWLDAQEGTFTERLEGDQVRIYFSHEKTMGRQIIFENWWVVRLEDGRIVSMSALEFESKFRRYSEEGF